MDAPLLETFTEELDTARAFRRFALDFTICVSLSSDKPTARVSSSLVKTPATLINASMSGLGFSSLAEFAEGAVIEIEVDLGGQTHRIPAVVRRCTSSKRLGRTFYGCGVQYLQSEATLRFLPAMVKYLLTHDIEKKNARHKS